MPKNFYDRYRAPAKWAFVKAFLSNMKKEMIIVEVALSELYGRFETIVETALDKRLKQIQSSSNSNDLLTGKQVQRLFGISASSLYNYTRIGMIDCLKMGRLNRYSEKQIKSVLTKLNTGGFTNGSK